MQQKCAVVIPTFNPTPDFIPYVEELNSRGVALIVIVDDGSHPETQSVFKKLAELPSCILLVHPENRGKGAGLKTAFRYLKENHPEIACLVTADSDGQHAISDVLNLFEALKSLGSGIVLGVRDFDGAQVPAKNAFGNKLTSWVFKVLFGTYVSDTQTGLRGFFTKDADWLLSLKGDRFEYEMNMLMVAVHHHVPIHEVPIQTLYFGKNPPSHYKTIRDSWRIAKQLAVGVFVKDRLL